MGCRPLTAEGGDIVATASFISSCAHTHSVKQARLRSTQVESDRDRCPAATWACPHRPSDLESSQATSVLVKASCCHREGRSTTRRRLGKTQGLSWGRRMKPVSVEPALGRLGRPSTSSTPTRLSSRRGPRPAATFPTSSPGRTCHGAHAVR